MPVGVGNTVLFHGAFTSKSDAERKERSRDGAWIKRVTIRGRKKRGSKKRKPGHTRYLVMTPR